MISPLSALLLLCAPLLACGFNIPSYYVIGQQKSGTSTLWNIMSTHPELTTVANGKNKEPFYFNGGKTKLFHTEHCDRNISGYLELWSGEDGKLAGDHTAVLLSCHCCPEVLSIVNPKAKVIAVLRDPATRSLSRFTEIRKFEFTDLPKLTPVCRMHKNLEEYAEEAVAEIQKCMQGLEAVPNKPENARLRAAIEYRCLEVSNIVGWSAYSVFLKRWLEFFPPEQLLVLYTSDLEEHPYSTIRKVEGHLGISAHAYSDDIIGIKLNTKQSYGWRKTPDDPIGKGKRRDMEDLDGVLDGDLTKLRRFFKPYMMELNNMAERGLVAPPPAVMMKAFL